MHPIEMLRSIPAPKESAEWAAWASAVGSTVAIVAAFIVGHWQARASVRAVLRGRQLAHLDVAGALERLAEAAYNLQLSIGLTLTDEESVRFAATGHFGLQEAELQYFGAALEKIDVHLLPPSIVDPALNIRSLVRQYHAKIKETFEAHRTLGRIATRDFLRRLEQLCESLGYARADLRKELIRLRKLN